MPDRDQVMTVVREWLIKAENDLKNATHTIKPGGRLSDRHGHVEQPLAAVAASAAFAFRRSTRPGATNVRR